MLVFLLVVSQFVQILPSLILTPHNPVLILNLTTSNHVFCWFVFLQGGDSCFWSCG